MAHSKKLYQIRLPQAIQLERAAKRKKYILSCLEEKDEAEEDGRLAQQGSQEEGRESKLGNFAKVRTLCNKTRRMWQEEFLIDLQQQR